MQLKRAIMDKFGHLIDFIIEEYLDDQESEITAKCLDGKIRVFKATLMGSEIVYVSREQLQF